MHSSTILNPSKVLAYRLPNGQVMLNASGYEDGFCKIRIQPTQAFIEPPIYAVYGESCPEVIGMFPYNVSNVIHYPLGRDMVAFQTSDKQLNVPIAKFDESTPGLADLVELQKNQSKHQVIGYAYNSSNFQTAFAHAVSQLQQQFPGKTHAKVVTSGFVGVGSPVGIAFTYVVMENAS